MDGKFTRILVFLSAFFLSSTLFGFTVQISSTNVTCNGDNNGTATASIVDGGGSTFTYSWSNNETGLSIYSLAPGSYTVTATDANGATATSSVYISQPAPMSVVMSSSYETCDISNDGTAGVIASGGTPVGSYDVLWSDGQTGWVAYNLSAGNYSVTVTDANGCSVVGNVSVDLSPEGIWISMASTDVSCASDCDGTATVMPMTGALPYTFQWTGSSQTTDHVTGLCAGDYTVTVTDANGCTAAGDATVNQPTPIVVTTTSTPSGCAGSNSGSASASANGGTPGYTGYTYTWSNGGSGATIMNLASGDYIVTVTDSKGCSTTSSVTVGQSASSDLGFTLSANDVSCNGNCDGNASVNITSGAAPYSYIWSTGSTSNSTSGLCAGQYSVTVSDASGCPIAQTFIIGTPDAITLNLSATNTNCGAADGTATVSATGGNGGYTYAWTNGQNTTIATGLNSGLQGVTVTDQNGCTASGSVTVGQTGSSITATVEATPASCRTNSDGSAIVTVTSGTAPFTYTWSNNAVGANATGLAAGSYTVTVQDVAGCPLVLAVVITAPTSIFVELTATAASCGSTNGAVTSVVSGGTGAYTYLWNYNNETTPNLTGVPAGNYILTVADENLCLGAGTITVNQVGGEVVASTASTPTSCYDSNDGTATITVTSGNAPYTYAWDNGSASATATGLAGGGHGWTVTDATGCMATGLVDVTSPTAMELTMSSENATCGGENGSANVDVTGGTAPYTYKWNGSFGQTVAHAMFLPAGIYTVLVTDANGCTASGTVEVSSTSGFTCNAIVASSYNGAHISSIGGNDGSATVTMSGGNTGYFSFAWTNGQTSQQITNLSAGTYSVVVKDDLTGCTCESSVTLEDPSKLGNYVWIDANSNGIQDASETGVEGVTVQVTGTSAYGLVIDLTTTTDVNGMYMFTLPPGDYKVTFTKPANHDFTLANQGGDDAADSDVDPTMGMTEVVTLTSGEYNPNLDAGLIKNCVTVGDFVWYDVDQDGGQENGAAGVNGFAVNLISAGPDGNFNTADDVVEASTTTDNTGHYLFDCVLPGTYVVEFDPASLPAGYQFTKKNGVLSDEKDSDANESGRTHLFTVTIAGGDDLTLDAGIHTLCNNVTNGGIIGYAQSICPNQVPDKLITLVEASGGTGELEFIWMKAQPGAPFAMIPGSTTTDYQPPALFNTTIYRKCARRVGCSAYFEPPSVTITVKDTCGGNFVSVSGSTLGDAIAVNWITGPESGEFTYQVERSANGEDFFAMEIMLGHGINNGFNNYSFTDNHPRRGTNYYRVIMNGPNSFEMSSDVIKVMGKHAGQNLALFPNPAGEVFYVDIMKENVSNGQVQIFDTNGKLVKAYSIEAGDSGPRRFLIPELSSGVYFVKITVDGSIEMMKLRKE